MAGWLVGPLDHTTGCLRRGLNLLTKEGPDAGIDPSGGEASADPHPLPNGRLQGVPDKFAQTTLSGVGEGYCSSSMYVHHAPEHVDG